MPTLSHIESLWLHTRERLVAKRLLGDDAAALALRCPGSTAMCCGALDAERPQWLDWRDPALPVAAQVHAQVYLRRPDVGASAWSAGAFGHRLADVGGVLPQVFDEQARHIGPMPAPFSAVEALATAPPAGGSVLLLGARPLCLGITAQRLALNVELFEKCAKAYVLAAAAGGQVRELPWWVRRIANGRLRKDQMRAAAAFAAGELPAESKGY
ncbi:hypothetical protein [Xanthomonas sp. CFBP 8445]|uniref:hypothetical protein n=1 Tax=Xanthomonas sp. CFBP 8445 TaxID=2971236 RepID=UPI0021DF744F|nr:hypothetical protein [Xanthomonas sp. CFBP 8445]UYC13548.1 hypothetical protein NUG21_07390 [Xanthomonas sp. CFBP 8445]